MFDCSQEFWDAEENCELINQKFDGNRDEIFLHEGDEIRFSKDGSRFVFRVERDERLNGKVSEDGSDAAADTLLLYESPVNKAHDDSAATLSGLAARLGGGGGEREENHSENLDESNNVYTETNHEPDRIDDGSDYDGDTDIDENLVEETRAENKESDSEMDRILNQKPSDDGQTASTFVESPNLPGGILDTRQNERHLATPAQPSSQTQSQSQNKERRLPSWWSELVKHEEIVPKKRPFKPRKRKASISEEDFEAKDVKRKKHSPQKRETDKNKNILSPGSTSVYESKATPGQRVKSSVRRSEPDNEETKAKHSLSPSNASVNLSDPSTVSPSSKGETKKPTSAMFSRANFGTLMNVLDSDDDDYRINSQPTESFDFRPVKEHAQIKTEAASDDAMLLALNNGDSEEHLNDDVQGDFKDAVMDELSDRDSWEDVTPPSTPVRGASTPAKEKKTDPSSFSVTSKSRKKCQFGKDCYRKNPVHFQECSHPNDADWVDDDEEEEEEGQSQKPECEFGADCYR